MLRKNICPVCGYDELLERPYEEDGLASYEICGCCGFQFGYDDYDLGITHSEYREYWIENGCKWRYSQLKPNGWSLKKQLKNLKNKEN